MSAHLILMNMISQENTARSSLPMAKNIYLESRIQPKRRSHQGLNITSLAEIHITKFHTNCNKSIDFCADRLKTCVKQALKTGSVILLQLIFRKMLHHMTEVFLTSCIIRVWSDRNGNCRFSGA